MDLNSPLSFHPSPMQDHVTLEINLIVKIGVKDCEDKEELKSFKKIMHERIKTTGAEVVAKKSDLISRDPYTGSLREKLYMNSLDESKPTKDDHVH